VLDRRLRRNRPNNRRIRVRSPKRGECSGYDGMCFRAAAHHEPERTTMRVPYHANRTVWSRPGLASDYAVSMLVLAAVFALVTIGFVIPCAIDVATTPSRLFDIPTKQTWLIVAVGFWAFGAAAWLIFGRREIRLRAACDELAESWGTQASTGRNGPGLWSSPSHPAGLGLRPGHRRRLRPTATMPTRFIAPDDNPEFLLELDRMIRNQHPDD